MFLGKTQKNCVDYVENTPDYAEISTVNKIDKKVQTTVKRKALQSFTDNLSSLIECIPLHMLDLIMVFTDRCFFIYTVFPFQAV